MRAFHYRQGWASRHGIQAIGAGRVRQGYVHIDDLVELYVLTLERAPAGTMLHAVTDEIALGEAESRSRNPSVATQ